MSPLNLTNYRSVAPTGVPQDPTKKVHRARFWGMAEGQTVGSRFVAVFRTTVGFGGCGGAFYHPADRIATHGHTQWPTQQPHLVWTSSHTIVDYLEEFHALLNCGDYLSI